MQFARRPSAPAPVDDDDDPALNDQYAEDLASLLTQSQSGPVLFAADYRLISLEPEPSSGLSEVSSSKAPRPRASSSVSTMRQAPSSAVDTTQPMHVRVHSRPKNLSKYQSPEVQLPPSSAPLFLSSATTSILSVSAGPTSSLTDRVPPTLLTSAPPLVATPVAPADSDAAASGSSLPRKRKRGPPGIPASEFVPHAELVKQAAEREEGESRKKPRAAPNGSSGPPLPRRRQDKARDEGVQITIESSSRPVRPSKSPVRPESPAFQPPARESPFNPSPTIQTDPSPRLETPDVPAPPQIGSSQRSTQDFVPPMSASPAPSRDSTAPVDAASLQVLGQLLQALRPAPAPEVRPPSQDPQLRDRFSRLESENSELWKENKALRDRIDDMDRQRASQDASFKELEESLIKCQGDVMKERLERHNTATALRKLQKDVEQLNNWESSESFTKAVQDKIMSFMPTVKASVKAMTSETVATEVKSRMAHIAPPSAGLSAIPQVVVQQPPATGVAAMLPTPGGVAATYSPISPVVPGDNGGSRAENGAQVSAIGFQFAR